MAPRPRRREKNRPDNVTIDVKNGVTYYGYRNPITGHRTSLGKDKARCYEAARALNAHFANQLTDVETEKLVGKVLKDRETVGDFIALFSETILPARRSKRGKPLAEKTLAEYRIMLRTIDREFGPLSWDSVTLPKVAAFLDKLKPRASNAHRSLMAQLWRHAIAKGKTGENIPDKTIPQDHVVERLPLTLAWYQAVHEQAEPWFKNALDLALQTLQRREDIVAYRFDAIQTIDGVKHLPVRQQKTENTSDAGRLLLPIGQELDALITRCRDDIVSPYMVHRKPKKRRREYLDKKDHWTAVEDEMLTREFAKLRDNVSEMAALPAAKRPTFHEIRGLGADLYRQAGWSEEAIQRLLGHSTEKMTKQYLDKHKEEWLVTDVVGLRV